MERVQKHIWETAIVIILMTNQPTNQNQPLWTSPYKRNQFCIGDFAPNPFILDLLILNNLPHPQLCSSVWNLTCKFLQILT
jgi:hypothetical protein